jgi:hypothetical protein
VSRRTISVQVATIIFTSRLKRDLSSFGQSAEDLSTLLGEGLGTSNKIPAAAAHVVLRAYQASIRDGLIVAIVFAALSLMFAVALPWPRLKGGITDQGQQDDELEINHVSLESDNNSVET